MRRSSCGVASCEPSAASKPPDPPQQRCFTSAPAHASWGAFLFGGRRLHPYPAIPAWLGIAVGWTVAALALWKGGRAERLAALGFLVAWLASPLLRHGGWEGPAWTGLLVDGLFLALLLWIALSSGRYWPLFAAAFELLSVFTHLARLIDPGVRAWAYATADAIWTYLLLAALCAGVVSRWRKAAQPIAAADAATVEPGVTRR
ncbi:MAG TPA: hypothetical protein VLI41_03725 [Phenylobacterium sp.]|uniref:hypothetical protein n=1 Tax=Phenylobacterium sp. TaxID=1871053 RepID=UPI002CF40E3D|nr:hypothetical protein [Phenylobacterium sp.]HSV02293.1 hypothetical protein [Phenylobacterium sp.]